MIEEKELTADEIKEIDDLDDFDLEENKVIYEIWLIGNDTNNVATGFEYLIDGNYTAVEEAEKCFNYFSDFENIKILSDLNIPTEVKYLFLRLECAELNEDNDVISVELYNEKEFNLKEEK